MRVSRNQGYLIGGPLYTVPQYGCFPKFGVPFGVPVTRIIVFWGPYWGPLDLGNYDVRPYMFRGDQSLNAMLGAGRLPKGPSQRSFPRCSKAMMACAPTVAQLEVLTALHRRFHGFGHQGSCGCALRAVSSFSFQARGVEEDLAALFLFGPAMSTMCSLPISYVHQSTCLHTPRSQFIKEPCSPGRALE